MPQLEDWEPVETQAGQPQPLTSLRVATMNVWFGQFYFEERCRATLALLESYRPDLIALQEVTPAFLDRALAAPWIREGYTLSDISGRSVDPYGVLILSRLPILGWELVPLPGNMGRDLVIVRASLQLPLTFASVHLESHAYSTPIRAEQLARIFARLAQEKHVILTGDFNLDASWEENRNLDPSYQDIWARLHPCEPGYTEDTDVNTMRRIQTGKHKQVRFDRILLRSGPPGWQAESIQRIGTEPIDPALPEVFPSDHFGLIGTLTWQGA